MPKDSDIPTILRLDQDIQDAVDEFNRFVNKVKAIRTATLAVLMEILMDDIRGELQQHLKG